MVWGGVRNSSGTMDACKIELRPRKERTSVWSIIILKERARSRQMGMETHQRSCNAAIARRQRQHINAVARKEKRKHLEKIAATRHRERGNATMQQRNSSNVGTRVLYNAPTRRRSNANAVARQVGNANAVARQGSNANAVARQGSNANAVARQRSNAPKKTAR